MSGAIGYPLSFLIALTTGGLVWWCADLRRRSPEERRRRLDEISHRVAGGKLPSLLMLFTFWFLPALLLAGHSDQPFVFWLVAVPLPFVVFLVCAFATLRLLNHWQHETGQASAVALLTDRAVPFGIRLLIVALWILAVVGPVIAAALVIPKMFEL